MHRSFVGLADAYQSIADGKATLRSKEIGGESIQRYNEELAAVKEDLEANKRLNDAAQYYSDMELCTARISNRLREIDDIDLNLNPAYREDDADPISNQKRFIEDQCFRAQALLTGEYYLRNMHTMEVSADMADLDERINYTAKHWKHNLVELGIKESALAELQTPSVEAAQELLPAKSDSRKVRRNSVITQTQSSFQAAVADYSDYNAAEFSELHEILGQFMDQAFLNGANSADLSKEILDRCARFKNKILSLTNQLVEDKRRSVKSEVRDAQRQVRSLEGEIALLHSQNDEADQVLRNQKEADKKIRKMVESKFSDTLNQMGDHLRRIESKREAQQETHATTHKRFIEVQAMYQELKRDRLHADPFVRRRAENLVKGLLRNLNESDLKEQEDRETDMQTSYQQWKKIVEVCAEKERQLELMQVQEKSVCEDLAAHKARIEQERVVYREKVKILKSKDDDQSAKLRILEETLSDKARNERRKLHFEQVAMELKQPNSSNVKSLSTGSPGSPGSLRSGDGSDREDRELVAYEARLNREAEAGSDADSEKSSESPTQTSDIDDDDDDSTSSGNTNSTRTSSNKAVSRRRIKQRGLRAAAPICDIRTEALLGITREHSKRQEITTSVIDHMPRSVPVHVTGSEASDNAALQKAQKLFTALHTTHNAAPNATAGVARSSGTDQTEGSGTDQKHVEGWTETNSSPRSASVKFRGSGSNSSRRRLSTFSNAKVKFGFWADVDHVDDDDEDDGSASDVDAEAENGDRPGTSDHRRQRAVAVHSLSSTACYVALYYRYLKKFPNLNFRRNNPRLQNPAEERHNRVRSAASSSTDARAGGEKTQGFPPGPASANKEPITPSHDGEKPDISSEIVRNNNRFQFTIKEGLVVVKESLDALLAAKCIDKVIVSEALEKVHELERRCGLSALSGEEQEIRYQLHYMCTSLIHTIISRAPRLLLLKNSRKLFVEINTCMLALLGVVLNCSLVFWQPQAARWNSSHNSNSVTAATGGIAPERVEFICAHLIELIITQGEIDHRRPLSGNQESDRKDSNTRKTSTKTFRIYRPEDTPMGPAGFISLLRIQTGEILKKVHERSANATRASSRGNTTSFNTEEAVAKEDAASVAGSRPSTSAGAVPVIANVYRKGGNINYHELFDVFNKLVDGDAPIAASLDDGSMFTKKHRHSILALQLFLYLSLNHKEINLGDAVLMLTKGIQDCDKPSYSEADSVIPCDVDILLQQMHPGMVPAILSLELMRRVLEEEFKRVEFLQKIASAHADVADLQYLNVQFSTQFDISLKTGRDSESSGRSSLKDKNKNKSDGNESYPTGAVPPLLAPPAPESDPSGVKDETISSKSKPFSGLRVTKFKSTKDVHKQWVEDLEEHVGRLSEEITNLVRPSNSGIPVRDSAFKGNKQSEYSTPPVIPLPIPLVYKLLAHVNTLRNITAAHSVSGLARVQATHNNFISIMKDLLAARQKIIAIVTAMTMPMRKKLEWLRMKYNTIMEENATANKQVSEFNKLVEKYERDIATFKASIAQIDRDKHTMDYRRTRMLQMNNHDPQVQQLIVEHCTEEYFQKLTDIKAKEARLIGTIASFSNEFDHLNAQSDTLMAAQRSLNVIDQAQAEAEQDLDLRPGIGTPVFPALPGSEEDTGYPNNVENLNSHAAPKVPPPVSELLSAIDGFVQAQRLAENASDSALIDPPQKDLPSAAQVAERAKELERKRRKRLMLERMRNRLRLPLSGEIKKLRNKNPPSLPAKLLGFSQRIDGGLVAVKAPGASATVKRGDDASDSETELTLSDTLRRQEIETMRRALVYSGALQKEGMKNDLFGQKNPISLRERIKKQMLKKKSGKKVRLGDVVQQFMLSDYGTYEFRPETLSGQPEESPLLNALEGGEAQSEEEKEKHRKARLLIRGEPLSPNYVQMPALEQIGRKNRAFMSSLDREEAFHYEEVLRAEEAVETTPLDVRGFIADVIRAQRDEARYSRESARNTGEAHSAGITVDSIAAARVEFTDELPDDEDGEEEQDEFDMPRGQNMMVNVGDVEDINASSRAGQEQLNAHSSRDHNVGSGITYAEYLLWKSKKRQQQREGQQLEALKNSLNIQLRNSRRNLTTEAEAVVTAAEASEIGIDDSVLTEKQFEDLMVSNPSMISDEYAYPTLKRDYSAANSEVDFILSRSSSKADAFGISRKFSSKRKSVGSALRFNTSGMSDDMDELGDGPSPSAAVAAAWKRARENSYHNAGSVSSRARASLLLKLNRAMDVLDGRKGSSSSYSDSSSQSGDGLRRTIRKSVVVDKLGTIPERQSMRKSLIGRKSVYAKKSSMPDLPLDEARIIAHTIVHGAPPPVPKSSSSGTLSLQPENNSQIYQSNSLSRGYDLQILEYIANDQLILSGWESVDLTKMNDNETFSGHTFRFDDNDDKNRASVLKEFAAQMAVDAEKSSSAVESEFRAAIVNLNRLVGKKISDAEVKTQLTQAVAAGDTVAAEVKEAAELEVGDSSSEAIKLKKHVKIDRHRHHHAILAGGEGALERANSYDQHSYATATIAAEDSTTDTPVESTIVTDESRVAGVNAGVDKLESVDMQPTEDINMTRKPSQPTQPKPSASFASPRKKVVNFSTEDN